MAFKTNYLLILLLLTPFYVEGAKTKKNSKVKVDPEVVLEEGRKAFMEYDFETASEKYSEYRELQEKKKNILNKEFEENENQLMVAVNAFDRVEKIIVIDSINVPSASFYNSYNLSKSSGQLTDGSQIKNNPGVDEAEYCFIDESCDYVIWSETNDEGKKILKEANKLIGDKWEIREIDLPDMELTGDLAFPFMSSDGQTLYFSAKGEDSIGGYDIFVAQRDPISGEFKQPLNLGMPYNSPADDILMAIDEETGLGWWATGRHSDDDNITIYVYILNEIRRNYPSDTENLISLARLDNYKETQVQEDGGLIVIPAVPKKIESAENFKGDFKFEMGNGKIYSTLKDFKNKKASEAMSQYLKKRQALEEKENKLSDLRRRYHNQDKGVVAQIENYEATMEKERAEVKALKSEVYRLERSTR